MLGYIIDNEIIIKALDKVQKYKYLGISEATEIDKKIMRKTNNKKYLYILKKILKTNLTTKNKIT